MIDFKNEISKFVSSVVESLQEDEVVELIEIPPNFDMGDYALPCFKLSKMLRKSPNVIAEEIASLMKDNEYFERIENAGPYINFFVDKERLAKSVFTDVFEKGDKFGSTDIGKGKTVIVEFSSVNIAKPFHIGHIRSTVIGHSLYQIYKFLGFNAVSINHLGDYGTQFGKLIVAYKNWGDKKAIEENPIPELLKIYVKYHEEAETHPELEDEARLWFKRLENKDKEAQELWQWFIDVSLKEFKRVYNLLGVEFDSYAGESFYSDKMPKVVKEMDEMGILQESEGAQIVDLEPYDLPPALITKSDGSTLYITRDIAAATYRKENYGFYKNIYIVGSQQNLHFQQLKKIIELMGHEWAKDCIHVAFGMVSLEEGTMSTRKGRVVFLEDVLKRAIDKTKEIILERSPDLVDKDKVARQVGVGAIVFQELYNNRIKDYVFSWDRTLSFQGETGPYVQYTYARANSVLLKAQYDITTDVDFSLLTNEEAVDVTRLVESFPQMVIDAMEKNEPSFITRYITNLAQGFNKFYHECPIIVEDEKTQRARLLLVYSVKNILKTGLSLLGIESPEKM